MIEIDDAGSGSLVGGTCIGIIRRETNEFVYDIIPVELYKPPDYENKAYTKEVISIVKKLFDKISVSKDEKIKVCSSYIFDELRHWMIESGYSWENSKIQDPLQSLIEKTFEQHAVMVGLPQNFIRFTRYPFHFHRLLKWVFADYDTRVRVCKTGWKSWQKYGLVERKETYGFVEKSNYYCLKCGQKINDGSFVKIIKYTSDRKNTVFLHDHC